jgi:hypothetical protein
MGSGLSSDGYYQTIIYKHKIKYKTYVNSDERFTIYKSVKTTQNNKEQEAEQTYHRLLHDKQDNLLVLFDKQENIVEYLRKDSTNQVKYSL